MIPYSLNVAILIAISVLFYRTLLQKETFFRLNRVILLSCIILSFIIPLIHVPASFSFRTPVVKTEEPIGYIIPVNEQAVLTISQPVNKVPPVQINTNTTPEVNLLQTSVTLGLKYIPFIYWAGVIIMGLNLLFQILVLLYKSRKNRVIDNGLCRIVEVEGDLSPCSFANRIFINPEKYDWQTYNQILQHEKIHVLQGHSFDLLFTEVMLVFQWFNPFAWLYRKDVENNLEYLTDDSVLKQSEFEKSDYQMSLVKVSVPSFSMNITNNYNQSLLKKRILMMNTRRSNVHGMWKYLTLVFIMTIMVCNFNEPLAAAVAKIVPVAASKELPYKNVFAATTEQIPAATRQLKNDTAPVAMTQLPEAATNINTEDDTASSLKFSNTIGRISTKFEGGKFIMPFPDDTVKADAAYIRAISNVGYGSLSQIQMDSLKRAGVTPDFIKDISALGYLEVPYKILCILKLARVTPAYIKSFSDLGYGKLTLSKLISFKFSKIEADYIKSLQRAGLNVPLDLVTMAKLENFTPEYIKGFADLGYKDLPFSRISMWKMEGINPDYIKGFNEIGFNNIPVSTLSFLKMGKITPEFVTEMKDKGVIYEDLKKYAFLKKAKS